MGLKAALGKLKIDKNSIDDASDGRQAVDKVEASFKSGYNFKLILMDINMPEMDGIEATTEIVKICQE